MRNSQTGVSEYSESRANNKVSNTKVIRTNNLQSEQSSLNKSSKQRINDIEDHDDVGSENGSSSESNEVFVRTKAAPIGSFEDPLVEAGLETMKHAD